MKFYKEVHYMEKNNFIITYNENGYRPIDPTISFEQKLKRAFLRKARRKGGKCRELSRSSAFESRNAEKHRKRAGRAA